MFATICICGGGAMSFDFRELRPKLGRDLGPLYALSYGEVTGENILSEY